MNFFKLYIGDYQRDTAHLSIAEHGAYMLMLQHYYATEKPLPSGKALHRMLRAQDKTERDAIDKVSSEFWKDTPAGLVNERADVEITKARAQADTNARIAREREERRKGARKAHEESTNRATNDQPIHSHSHSQTKEEAKDTCAEPCSGSPPFITIPLNDGSEFDVTEAQRDEWRNLFPAVDVDQELRNAKAWSAANQSRRKTRRGVKSFLTAWLTRAQDKPRNVPHETRQRVDNSAVARVERAYAHVEEPRTVGGERVG